MAGEIVQCESCGIIAPGSRENRLLDYREHRICSWCIDGWKNREELFRRGLTRQEFTKGITK